MAFPSRLSMSQQANNYSMYRAEEPVDERTQYIRDNINPLYKLNKDEAIDYATSMGVSDSLRGIAQLFGKGGDFFGWDALTNSLKKKDKKLQAILEHPEYGKDANIAFLTSAIAADPVSYIPIAGWISKGKKAKNLKDLAIYGGSTGAIVSSLGYTPEDKETLLLDEDASLIERRLENAGIGLIAGGILGPAIGKSVDVIQKARGKPGIFAPDEIEPKKFDDDFVDEDTLNQPITVGSTVRAKDRKNIGTVIELDEEKGVATVRFVNKETGNTATKRFSLNDLQDTKPGQQKKKGVVLGEEVAEKPKDVIFVIDKETTKGNPIYKATNSKNKITYSIQKAVDEQGNIIPKQWEVTTIPFLRGRKKGESIADFNRRKKALTQINLFGSLRDAKQFVRNNIQPNKTVPIANQKDLETHIVQEISKPTDQKYSVKYSVGQAYKDKVGTPLYNIVFNNPAESLGGFTGGYIGYNAIDNPEATYAQKLTAGLIGTISGAGVTRYGVKNTPDNFKDIVGRMFIDKYGLRPEYIKLKQNFRANKNEIAMEFKDIVEKASKELNEEQNTLLYGLINGDIASIEKLSPEALNLNAETRALITKYALEFVDRGMLDEKVFKKNIDTYIKRTYRKPKQETDKVFYETNKQIRIIGDELKPRGLVETTTKKDFDNVNSKWKKEGWEILEELKGGKVKVRRQYTKQERKDLEEIENASYAIAETGRLFAHDISTARFFDDLSKNKNFVLDEADWKALPKSEQNRFAMMPSSRVQGTKQLKYGELSGKYIEKNVLQDIKHTFNFSIIDKAAKAPIAKYFDKLQTLWKKTKTAWSVPTHVGNTASNVMLLDFADVGDGLFDGLKMLFKGIKEMRNPNSKIHRQAKIDGIFDVDLVSKELGNELSEIERALTKLQNKENFGAGILDKTWEMTKKYGKLPAEKMERLYQLEDQIFRMAVYMDRINKGFSRSDAALDARKWFIDYDINATAVQALKRTMVPFISYTYRVIPLLAESAILRPQKFIKWGAFGYGLNEGFTYLADDELGEEMDRLTVRQEYNKRMFGGVPAVGDLMPYTNIRMPVDDENGNAVYLDVGRWIPGGDIFEQRSTEVGLPGVPANFQPGGIFFDAFYTAFSKQDPYTGRDLEEYGVDTDNIGSIAAHFAKAQIPNIPYLKGAYGTRRYEKAKRIDIGELDGERVYGSQYIANDTPFLALAYMFGLRLRPQDAYANKKLKTFLHQKERDEINTKIKSIPKEIRKGNLTSEEAEKRRVKLQEELYALNAEWEIYQKKLGELEGKLSEEGFKKLQERQGKVEGGIVKGKDVPYTKENPADRVNPFTGSPYSEQIIRLGLARGGSNMSPIVEIEVLDNKIIRTHEDGSTSEIDRGPDEPGLKQVSPVADVLLGLGAFKFGKGLKEVGEEVIGKATMPKTVLHGSPKKNLKDITATNIRSPKPSENLQSGVYTTKSKGLARYYSYPKGTVYKIDTSDISRQAFNPAKLGKDKVFNADKPSNKILNKLQAEIKKEKDLRKVGSLKEFQKNLKLNKKEGSGYISSMPPSVTNFLQKQGYKVVKTTDDLMENYIFLDGKLPIK